MVVLYCVASGPPFMVDVHVGDRFGVFGFGEALFAPSLGVVGFRDPGENGAIAPNVLWRRSPVSGFFGAGLSVRFQ